MRQPASARAVFLFGVERSGITLLSMMIGAHPEIAVPLATTGVWFDFRSKLGGYGVLATPSDCRHTPLTQFAQRLAHRQAGMQATLVANDTTSKIAVTISKQAENRRV